MTPHSQPITSIKALQRTIETDNEVFRWFLHLITQPAAISDISTEENARQKHIKLKTFVFYQRILWTLLLFLFLSAYFSRESIYVYSSMAVLLWTIPIHQRIRKLTTEISICLLSKDFNKENFGHLTLYQIGEFYSKKYGIRSLVTMISSVDAMVRRMLFYTWVLATFVNPLGARGFWLMLFGGYIIFQTIINTSLIYDRIK